MTTFRLDTSAGPGTHVFIVGVGNYPHLKGGDGTESPDHRGLGQLTSPPLSAMKMVEWCDKTLNNPQAPLKSIEVLISQPGQASYTDTTGTTTQINAATWDHFESAAMSWFNRANTDKDNVAVFYFCGHGIGDGINTHLLMADTGRSPVFQRQALHLPGFRIAMGECRALKQIFFVDTCRTVDPATILNPYITGQPGLSGTVTKVFNGANPVLYAARMGEQAFGDKHQVSHFTAALLEGLNRCGVFRPKGTTWAVQPQELQKAVAALLDDFSGKPQCPADGLSGLGFQLHVLQKHPEVVVHVTLDNPTANDAAAITCTAAGTVVTRSNSDHPWRTFLPAGPCAVQASFSPPSPYTSAPVDLYLFPPFQDIELEVQ
jgi:hypothetical protein